MFSICNMHTNIYGIIIYPPTTSAIAITMTAYSQAAERNKLPIFSALKAYLNPTDSILEIGSGTGQHAVFFKQTYPELTWQASDTQTNLSTIEQYFDQFSNLNLNPVVELDVDKKQQWPQPESYDHVFSANTCHIMAWHQVENMLTLVARVLKPLGYFFLYGPFNQNGEYTSDSNRQFDQFLKAQAPHMGLRALNDVIQCANAQGLSHRVNHQMPHNNQLLVFKKR